MNIRYHPRALVISAAAVVIILVSSVIAVYSVYTAQQNTASLNARLSRFEILMEALHTYDDNVGHLPEAIGRDAKGKPLYSWRLSILPFTEAVKDRVDLNAPWTAKSNQYFAQRPIYLFCNPNRQPQADRFRSELVAIIGTSTAMQLYNSRRLKEVPCDTIIIIEAEAPSLHWMAPGDISPDDVDRVVNLDKHDDIIVGFADGEIWSLSRSVPADILRQFMIVDGDRTRDREAMLGPYRLYSRSAGDRSKCKGRAEADSPSNSPAGWHCR